MQEFLVFKGRMVRSLKNKKFKQNFNFIPIYRIRQKFPNLVCKEQIMVFLLVQEKKAYSTNTKKNKNREKLCCNWRRLLLCVPLGFQNPYHV